MTSSNSELHLAREIGNCCDVAQALANTTHPCRKVVLTQGSDLINRQRPEPWFGNLAESKVLFVASNPSINDDPGDLGEEFPTFEWSPEVAAEFFVDRVTDRADSPVSFQHSHEADFLTKCRDGQYRSGMSNPKKPQPTWKNTHDRAIELLGSAASPARNYAITEVVHCKSRMGQGVLEAASFCAEKWMSRLLDVSPAKVVVLLGRHVRDSFAIPSLDVPPDFGLGPGYESLQPSDRCVRDTLVSSHGGKDRVFIFNWHPTAMKLRTLSKVYGANGVAVLQGIALGDSPVPESTLELHSMLLGR